MKTKIGKINVVTLGCSKNTVDSETLIGQLDANNLQVVHNTNDSDAKTVIINTCGFIKDAKEESVNTILNFAHAKERGEIDNLFVMGCLSERYKPDLEKEIPEVDSFFGSNNIKDIIDTIGVDYKKDLVGERELTTPDHYAYLKISEGCDRYCSFCAIPIMRGKHKSKSIEDLLKEVTSLANKGVKELILIAQDLTYYGIDIYGKQRITELLNKISEVKGIEWIRLHYAYPADFPKDLIATIRDNPKICKYLDMPIQHISNDVLKKMRRGHTTGFTQDLINRIKKEIPGITMRTTIMVGHPGESEEAFNELLAFVKDFKYDRLGVFTYSEEEDTFGARSFKDEIEGATKLQRQQAIMDAQERISFDLNQKKVGSTIKVIIDRIEDHHFVGRSEADSPEVDNEVIVSSDKILEIGEFYDVKVTEATEFDLFATI